MKRALVLVLASVWFSACGGSEEPAQQPQQQPPMAQPPVAQPAPVQPAPAQPPVVAQPTPVQPAPAQPPAALPPAAPAPAASTPTAIPGVFKHADGMCSITPPVLPGQPPAAPIKGPCPPGI